MNNLQSLSSLLQAHNIVLPLANDRTRFIEEIREKRSVGSLSLAIDSCIRARQIWPGDRFFTKILADLYLQNGEHQAAFLSLSDFLNLLTYNRHDLSDFAKRYTRFRQIIPAAQMDQYSALLLESLDESSVDPLVAREAKEIILRDIGPDFTAPSDKNVAAFLTLLEKGGNFDEFVKIEKQIEVKYGGQQLIQILDKLVLPRKRIIQTFRIDLYCVSIYERFGFLDKALKVISELIPIKHDLVAIRSLFRICRSLKDYTYADELLEKFPKLIRENDFNVLYEFVYYFEAKSDFHMVQSVLRTMDKSFATNVPVLRTVRNFYIRFGMLDEARRVEKTVHQSGVRGSGEKYIAEVVESATELASKVQDLYSQLEHQKQLAAISDLTTGISHELGQPITNIRYTIQYHRKLFARDLSYTSVSKVFDSILEETERMGGLIRRLAPLTSSRGVVERFDIMDRIQRRVEGEEPRLKVGNIKVSISPRHPMWLVGDPVKFDQLLSNLVLNAIDAIGEKKDAKKRAIEIVVDEDERDTRITFTDTGVGIPSSNRNKIFDPFFSTKPPGKGEGLGLFIVWNLLKMLGGRINVDTRYKNGAKFLITVPKQLENIAGG